ncbi:hypothetical protein ACNKHS_09630 [Shigella flexneri]
MLAQGSIKSLERVEYPERVRKRSGKMK